MPNVYAKRSRDRDRTRASECCEDDDADVDGGLGFFFDCAAGAFCAAISALARVALSHPFPSPPPWHEQYELCSRPKVRLHLVQQ